MDLATHAEAIAALYSPPATGRPSSISDADTLKELFKQIEAGNYLETACELAGLHVVTVHNWKKRGEAGEEPYAQFLKALKRASARAEALAVANVRQAGKLPQFWAAEMTYLERRHPERWGRRSEGSNEPRVVVQIGVKDSDVLVQMSTISDQGTPLSPPLSEPLHSVTPTADADQGPIISVPLLEQNTNSSAPATQKARRANAPKGPQPGQARVARRGRNGRKRRGRVREGGHRDAASEGDVLLVRGGVGGGAGVGPAVLVVSEGLSAADGVGVGGDAEGE